MQDNVLITEVTYLPIKPTSQGLIGFCSCLFDDKLSLNSIAVYSKPNGEIRLVFPDTYLANGKRLNVFYPIDNETYKSMKQAIQTKIENVTKEVIGDQSHADNRI